VNWENIKEDLKSIQNTVKTMKEMNHPINSIWDHFKTSLEESIKRNVPMKTTRNVLAIGSADFFLRCAFPIFKLFVIATVS
jgi:hypothetical protein